MQFNSKLLIFGEYTILKGSKALAIPFTEFSGQWLTPTNANESEKASTQILIKLVDSIKDKTFHAQHNEEDFLAAINNGLAFQSNVPNGYGLGSSGALCAAVYERFFTKKPDKLPLLKEDLALMESFFHGNSSGTDPLVSYLNQAIALNPDTALEDFTLDESVGMILIDSGQARSTEALMPIYKQKCEENPDFHQELINQTNVVIDAYLSHSPFLYTEIQHLCILQNHFLKDLMVLPEALKDYKLIFGEMLSLKLCGAGGGGYLLGFTSIHYHKEVLQKLKELGVKIIEIAP